jgi:hypothetical protein
MKTKLLFLFLLICFFYSTNAQEDNSGDVKAQKEEQKKQDKLAKKGMRAYQDSVAFAKARKAIDDKQFVLEARSIYGKDGEEIRVSETTNFISLVGDNASIQISSPSVEGSNGLGGITVNGKPTKIAVKESKKGIVSFSMVIMGTSLNAEISITFGPTGNSAEGRVTSMKGGSITFSGNLIPESESAYFKSGFESH